MASYNVLKAFIRQFIKENENKEITGSVLQGVLLQLVDSLGAGFQFIDIATPETQPGTGDAKKFYVCGEGSYPNFGENMVVPSGSIGFLIYSDSWTLKTIGIGGSSGGDADTVDGYHVQVLLPHNFNPETADLHTIYFLYKLGDQIVEIPAVVVRTYIPGQGGYMPVAQTGWKFVTSPSVCIDKGIYQFPISLKLDNAIWEDKTRENKIFSVIINPYTINVEPIIEVEQTGQEIPASALFQVPNSVNATYIILEGEESMINPGIYSVRLLVDDFNCEFKVGDNPSSLTAEVTVIVRGNYGNWVFGDSFPIRFGAANTVFGSNFPLRFV